MNNYALHGAGSPIQDAVPARLRRWGGRAAALALLAASALYGCGGGSAPKLQSGVMLDAPREIGEVRLTDDQGRAFTLDAFRDHFSLVFPGFTYCPDVCPTTLAVLAKVRQNLDAKGLPLQVVFLSVDPGRDTPARLHQYVQHFDPGFIGVTAPEAQLRAFAARLAIAYALVEGDAPESYSIDHSATIALIDEQARLVGYLTPPYDAATITQDLTTLLSNRSTPAPT
jgi:protein SCO1/2